MTLESDIAAATRIGSVRRMALDAARALLEESGPEALQLRTIAGRIGCGVSTLYHHFADKNALLAAVAIEGFREMEIAMVKAMASGEFSRRVQAAGVAYIRFMHRNLRLYALMHSESVFGANEEVRAAERAAFNAYQGSLMNDERIPAEHVEELALVGWAMARGVASVILAQPDVTPAVAKATAERIFKGFEYLIALRRMNEARDAEGAAASFPPSPP